MLGTADGIKHTAVWGLGRAASRAYEKIFGGRLEHEMYNAVMTDK